MEDELSALRQMLLQLRELLAGAKSPDGRSERAVELITAAISLSDDLLAEKPAAVIGAKGGKKTASRGPEYFKKIAGMRKTMGGGRPRKKR